MALDGTVRLLNYPVFGTSMLCRDSLRPYRPRHMPRFLTNMAKRTAGRFTVRLVVAWLYHFGSVAVYQKQLIHHNVPTVNCLTWVRSPEGLITVPAVLQKNTISLDDVAG